MGKSIKSFGDVINNYFEHVFVVSLPRSQQRQEEVTKELNKYNINFSFIEGVDGRKLDLDSLDKSVFDKEQNIKITKRPLTQGELGCTLSVLKICKKVVEENIDRVLVLQDDIRVISENTKFCQEMLSTANFPWDILYLGHWDNCLEMSLKIKVKLLTLDKLRYMLNKDKYKDPSLIRNSYRRNFSKNWYLAGAHKGAYAYGLSLEGAKKLIKAFTPVFAPDDTTFNHLVRKGELRAFSPKHFLIEPRFDLGSEIGHRPSWAAQVAREKKLRGE